MFFNFGNFGNILDCELDIYIGNQLMQSQQMTAPDQMLAAQFLQMCQQVASNPQPIHLVMRRYEDAWNQIDGKMERQEYKMEFWNKQEVW